MKDYWKEGLATIVIASVVGLGQLWQNHPTVQSVPTQQHQTDADLVMWQGIVNSNNPSDFEEYISSYPNGQFARIAKNRLQQFRHQTAAIQLSSVQPQLPQERVDSNETQQINPTTPNLPIVQHVVDEPPIINQPQTEQHYSPTLATLNAQRSEANNIGTSIQSWVNLFTKYQQTISIPAPNGYLLKNAPSSRARDVAIKQRDSSLLVVGHVDIDGQRFYMTEWSWSQHNKGKNPTWVVLLQPHNAMETPTTITYPSNAKIEEKTSANVKPSFDCNRAKRFLEIIVCKSNELAALDLRLSFVYKKAIASRTGSDKKNLAKQEQDWVKNVMYKCQTHDCVYSAYVSRISELE